MMVKRVINRFGQWIQILDQAADIVPTPIQYFPVNTLRQADFLSEDPQPCEYFLYLLCEEFLDMLIAKTNLFLSERKGLKLQ